jgi:thiamine biosynthesis lipoprotein ApbE
MLRRTGQGLDWAQSQGLRRRRGQRILLDHASRPLVNLGGPTSPGAAAELGVRHPWEPRARCWKAPLENRAAVTSGWYEKYFIRDAVR